MNPVFVIVGGGISGMVSALYIKKHYPDYSIEILESSNKLGGKLRGHLYKKSLYFDSGTHIFQETGIEQIDSLIRDAIPIQELVYFEPGKGDLVGSIFNNKLQHETHYPDVSEKIDYVDSVMNHLISSDYESIQTKVDLPLDSECVQRFGQRYAERLLRIIEQLYKYPFGELLSYYMYLPGLNRVKCYDIKDWKNYEKSEKFRQIVAYPDQYNVPEIYKHSRRSYYSKFFGTLNFIRGLEQILKQEGIQIRYNSRVTDIDTRTKKITFSKDDNYRTLTYDKLLIASGVFSAKSILIPDYKIEFDPPLDSLLIHLRLSQKTICKSFYVYNYDHDLNFYRITNYGAFSEQKGDTRISIECFNVYEADREDFLQKVLSYLKEIGFLVSLDYTDVYFEETKRGFPILTKNNLSQIIKIREQLHKYQNESFQIIGFGVGENFSFLQNHTLTNAIKIIEKMM